MYRLFVNCSLVPFLLGFHTTNTKTVATEVLHGRCASKAALRFIYKFIVTSLYWGP